MERLRFRDASLPAMEPWMGGFFGYAEDGTNAFGGVLGMPLKEGVGASCKWCSGPGPRGTAGKQGIETAWPIRYQMHPLVIEKRPKGLGSLARLLRCQPCAAAMTLGPYFSPLSTLKMVLWSRFGLSSTSPWGHGRIGGSTKDRESIALVWAVPKRVNGSSTERVSEPPVGSLLGTKIWAFCWGRNGKG